MEQQARQGVGMCVETHLIVIRQPLRRQQRVGVGRGLPQQSAEEQTPGRRFGLKGQTLDDCQRWPLVAVRIGEQGMCYLVWQRAAQQKRVGLEQVQPTQQQPLALRPCSAGLLPPPQRCGVS